MLKDVSFWVFLFLCLSVWQGHWNLEHYHYEKLPTDISCTVISAPLYLLSNIPCVAQFLAWLKVCWALVGHLPWQILSLIAVPVFHTNTVNMELVLIYYKYLHNVPVKIRTGIQIQVTMADHVVSRMKHLVLSSFSSRNVPFHFVSHSPFGHHSLH